MEKWSQMITLSGAENLAMIPDMTSERLLGQLETRCRLSCLPSFSVIELGKSMIDGHEAAIAVFSCGTADDDDEVKALSGPHSESALVAVIKGERDYYTLQWAERGKASSDPLTLNKAQWLERFGKLQPIKLCKRIPGEKRPFPSCLGRP
ncbi:MAG: hypothetical protein LBU39_03410 [Desulfobulbaceae bacterium]|nr:hypothetical protein [Desulfobulbaceae bacterium]